MLKFLDLSIKTLIFRIVEIVKLLPTKIQSNLSVIEINQSIAAILRKWANNNNYAISLESDNKYSLDIYTLNN